MLGAYRHASVHVKIPCIWHDYKIRVVCCYIYEIKLLLLLKFIITDYVSTKKVCSMVESDDDVTTYDIHPYQEKMRTIKC